MQMLIPAVMSVLIQLLHAYKSVFLNISLVKLFLFLNMRLSTK